MSFELATGRGRGSRADAAGAAIEGGGAKVCLVSWNAEANEMGNSCRCCCGGRAVGKDGGGKGTVDLTCCCCLDTSVNALPLREEEIDEEGGAPAAFTGFDREIGGGSVAGGGFCGNAGGSAFGGPMDLKSDSGIG